MLQDPKDEGKLASPSPNDIWACEACTFENSPTDANCAMCTTARAASLGPVTLTRTPSWPQQRMGPSADEKSGEPSPDDLLAIAMAAGGTSFLPSSSPFLQSSPSLMHAADTKKVHYLDEDKGSSGDSTVWECPQCTFHNSIEHSDCGICNYANPSLRPKLPPGQWECPTCTLVNSLPNKKCFACECAMPAHAEAGTKDIFFLFQASEPLINVIAFVLDELGMDTPRLTPIYHQAIMEATEWTMLTAGDIEPMLKNVTISTRLSQSSTIDSTFLKSLSEYAGTEYTLKETKVSEVQKTVEDQLKTTVRQAEGNEVSAVMQVDTARLRAMTGITNLMQAHGSSIKNINMTRNEALSTTFHSYFNTLFEMFATVCEPARVALDIAFLRRLVRRVGCSNRWFATQLGQSSRSDKPNFDLSLGAECDALNPTGLDLPDGDTLNLLYYDWARKQVDHQEDEKTPMMGSDELPFVLLLGQRLKEYRAVLGTINDPQVKEVIEKVKKRMRVGQLKGGAVDAEDSWVNIKKTKKVKEKKDKRAKKGGIISLFGGGFDSYLEDEGEVDDELSMKAVVDATTMQHRVRFFASLLSLAMSQGFVSDESAHMLSAIRVMLGLSLHDERAALASTNKTLRELEEARTNYLLSMRHQSTDTYGFVSTPSAWRHLMTDTGVAFTTTTMDVRSEVERNYVEQLLGTYSIKAQRIKYFINPDLWRAYLFFCKMVRYNTIYITYTYTYTYMLSHMVYYPSCDYFI